MPFLMAATISAKAPGFDTLAAVPADRPGPITVRRDDPRDFGRSHRAGLGAGGAVAQVAAQEEADAAVDAHLAKVHVRLSDGPSSAS